MRYLLLFVIAAFSASAQTGSPTPSGSASSPTINVSAELTKRIDSRNAHVGDPVAAKLRSTAALPDGTMLPKNTKLTGKISDVHAKSKEDRNASLSFSFDHAVLKNGQQIPIHAMLISLSVPAMMQPGQSMEGAPITPGGAGGVGAGGGRAGGGGTASTPGGGLQSTNGGLEQNAPDEDRQPQQQPADTGQGELIGSPNINLATEIKHMSVRNLPGVTFSSAATASDTATLNASGQDLDIDGGAQMTLRLNKQ